MKEGFMINFLRNKIKSEKKGGVLNIEHEVSYTGQHRFRQYDD
jgi:hypothetical protein